MGSRHSKVLYVPEEGEAGRLRTTPSRTCLAPHLGGRMGAAGSLAYEALWWHQPEDADQNAAANGERRPGTAHCVPVIPPRVERIVHTC